MLRWLKSRKDKKNQRRQEKHRKILDALKSKNTSDTGSDYGFYKDDFLFHCEIENKPHDYEEIDDVSNFTPQFSQLAGMDFRQMDTISSNQPPELPDRTLPNFRSVSVSACKDISTDDRFRERTISLPCFDKSRKQFLVAENEPFYNDPWDCKSNLIVKRESQDCQKETVELRLFEKINESKNNLQHGNSIILEESIYSEIEDSDTGCDSDTVSQTGSECSVFLNDNRNKLINSPLTLVTECEDFSDSDASSGFYDGHNEIEEEQHSRSSVFTKNKIASRRFLSVSCNTYPRSPREKIEEDSDLYLIPKRCKSLTETNTEIFDLPVQKKKIRNEHRRFDCKSGNRVLDDLIWKNNFKL